MQAPEAVRVGMYPALEEGASLGAKGPGSRELLGAQRDFISTCGWPYPLQHSTEECQEPLSELKEEARDSEVGSRGKK